MVSYSFMMVSIKTKYSLLKHCNVFLLNYWLSSRAIDPLQESILKILILFVSHFSSNDPSICRVHNPMILVPNSPNRTTQCKYSQMIYYNVFFISLYTQSWRVPWRTESSQNGDIPFWTSFILKFRRPSCVLICSWNNQKSENYSVWILKHVCLYFKINVLFKKCFSSLLGPML